MPITRTVSEFTSTRKVRYGGDINRGKNEATDLNAVAAKRSPLSFVGEEGISKQTETYGKDENGNDIYIIEFNIGSFQFDELTIKTDTNKLMVNGKTKKSDGDNDELCKTFKREFKLPKEVEEKSIKAELDEKTRQLKLVGQVISQDQLSSAVDQLSYQQVKSYTSMSSDRFASENSFGSNSSELSIGNIRANISTKLLEYEIYLGSELKGGQVIFEVPNKTTLGIRVCKTSSDTNGNFNLELKREIKLPPGAKLNQIDHGIDSRTKTLIIKVPLGEL